MQWLPCGTAAFYDICLTVTAWCIIGLLGVLLIRSFGFREVHQEKIIPWLVGIAMIFFLIALRAKIG